MIQQGGDLNLKSNKGINCFHLIILLFFYCPNFCNDKSINVFIELLNFNFNSSNFAIFSTKNIFSTIDLLYILQNLKSTKRIITKSFFPKKYKINLNYNQLNELHYNKLYLFLLMHNDKFFYVQKTNTKFITIQYLIWTNGILIIKIFFYTT